MATLILGLLVVSLSIVLAWFGLRTVRRLVPIDVLQSQHEVAGFMIGVLGVIYAALLAFVVVALWNQSQDARLVVEREANQLADLPHSTRVHPDHHVRQRLSADISASAS